MSNQISNLEAFSRLVKESFIGFEVQVILGFLSIYYFRQELCIEISLRNRSHCLTLYNEFSIIDKHLQIFANFLKIFIMSKSTQ